MNYWDDLTRTLFDNSIHRDFRRLAQGLKAQQIDFDYAKTRKLLDPKWDGYIINDLDIIDDDVDLKDANLLTSQHRNSELHRVVLDLDYGASATATNPGHYLTLNMHNPGWVLLDGHPGTYYLRTILDARTIQITPLHGGYAALHLWTERDLALIPSTTPGHHHLILDVNLPWEKYRELLWMLAGGGIIQHGYAKASIRKGYSAIRPPWVKKETKCQPIFVNQVTAITRGENQ